MLPFLTLDDTFRNAKFIGIDACRQTSERIRSHVFTPEFFPARIYSLGLLGLIYSMMNTVHSKGRFSRHLLAQTRQRKVDVGAALTLPNIANLNVYPRPILYLSEL